MWARMSFTLLIGRIGVSQNYTNITKAFKRVHLWQSFKFAFFSFQTAFSITRVLFFLQRDLAKSLTSGKFSTMIVDDSKSILNFNGKRTSDYLYKESHDYHKYLCSDLEIVQNHKYLLNILRHHFSLVLNPSKLHPVSIPAQTRTMMKLL